MFNYYKILVYLFILDLSFTSLTYCLAFAWEEEIFDFKLEYF